MTVQTRTSFADTDGNGRISAAEAMEMRRVLYADGLADRAEVEALFDLNERVSDDDPAWSALFVEAICDYVLRQEAPFGYVSDDEALWLQKLILRDRKVESATEVEALVQVLEKADGAPLSLSRFALELMARKVERSGRMSDADVRLIERVVFAAGGHGASFIDRTEAEVLFRINDAVEDAQKPVSFDDLFARAIANHLMALSAPEMLDHDEAQRREDWLSARGNLSGGFLKVFEGGLKGYLDKVNTDPRAQMNAHYARREDEARVAEAVTRAESAWLLERLHANRTLCRSELALIDRLEGFHPGLGKALRQQA